MSEQKMREALERLRREAKRIEGGQHKYAECAYSPSADTLEWIADEIEAALAEQPDREKYSTFENVEYSVETHAASKQPAQAEAVAWVNVVDLGGGMTRLDWKDGNWWHRLAAGTHTLYTAPPAPSVPDEVAKDAARYRWLRDQDHDDGCVISMKEKHIPRFVNYSTAIDNYIDAAMLAVAQEPRS